jgi:hypothetical protein
MNIRGTKGKGATRFHQFRLGEWDAEKKQQTFKKQTHPNSGHLDFSSLLNDKALSDFRVALLDGSQFHLHKVVIVNLY